MASSSASTSAKRQRLCEEVDVVDLSTQPAASEGELPATQLESDSDERDATPSDGSGARMTIRERCERIVAMRSGADAATCDEDDQSQIENSEEDHDVGNSQVYATPPDLDVNDAITATGSDQECIGEARGGAASDTVKGPAAFRTSWLLRSTSDANVGSSTLLKSVLEQPGDINAAGDQEHNDEASVLTLSSSDAASPSQRGIAQDSHGVEEDCEIEDAHDGQADHPARDDTDESDNDNECHAWLCEVRSGGTQQ